MAWHNTNSFSLDGLSWFAEPVLHNGLQIFQAGPMESILIAFLVTEMKVTFGDNFFHNNFILLIFDVNCRVTNLYT